MSSSQTSRMVSSKISSSIVLCSCPRCPRCSDCHIDSKWCLRYKSIPLVAMIHQHFHSKIEKIQLRVAIVRTRTRSGIACIDWGQSLTDRVTQWWQAKAFSRQWIGTIRICCRGTGPQKDAILSLPKFGFGPSTFARHGRNSLHARNGKEVKPNLYGITEKTAYEDKS
jgi:hypothetical protein